eukprot:2779247-Ditylum_brightwellii.AAC.1
MDKIAYDKANSESNGNQTYYGVRKLCEGVFIQVNGIQNPKWGFQGRARNVEISRVVTRKESGIQNL